MQVRAVYDYAAENNEELSIKEGDIITVILEDETGWWKGVNANGQSGLFPSNFTEQYPEVPLLAKAIIESYVFTPKGDSAGGNAPKEEDPPVSEVDVPAMEKVMGVALVSPSDE